MGGATGGVEKRLTFEPYIIIIQHLTDDLAVEETNEFRRPRQNQKIPQNNRIKKKNENIPKIQTETEGTPPRISCELLFPSSDYRADEAGGGGTAAAHSWARPPKIKNKATALYAATNQWSLGDTLPSTSQTRNDKKKNTRLTPRTKITRAARHLQR